MATATDLAFDATGANVTAGGYTCNLIYTAPNHTSAGRRTNLHLSTYPEADSKSEGSEQNDMPIDDFNLFPGGYGIVSSHRKTTQSCR